MTSTYPGPPVDGRTRAPARTHFTILRITDGRTEGARSRIYSRLANSESRSGHPTVLREISPFSWAGKTMWGRAGITMIKTDRSCLPSVRSPVDLSGQRHGTWGLSSASRARRIMHVQYQCHVRCDPINIFHFGHIGQRASCGGMDTKANIH
ncbi:hypothetical protein K466DRAFT_317293 [Polyporus arcularius HHB13444]|uniref:Uncharacterized protein n=1 Tax=Polyporus arcularius HHB13444 TaxID=1314778 RepID=A0A5C3NZ11_9APHY|nr:hypothetical protein K466DRAFT_317293 [Polyporus arcularius HHB13444]